MTDKPVCQSWDSKRNRRCTNVGKIQTPIFPDHHWCQRHADEHAVRVLNKISREMVWALQHVGFKKEEPK